MGYVILKPYCKGCGLEIDTPAECDMELFRLGLPCHKTDECLSKLENKLRVHLMDEHGIDDPDELL